MVLNACAGAIAPNEGLRNLLEYIRKGAVAPDDELISAMDAAVSAANEDREWVGSVMTVGDLLDDARADAIAEAWLRAAPRAVLKVLPGWLPLPRNWQKMAAPKTP